jgi:hypothetical protein
MSHRGSNTTRHEYAAERRARVAQKTARAEEQARREQAVMAALLHRRARDRHEPIAASGAAVQQVFARAPRLADGPYAGAVERLAKVPHVRPLVGWTPRGKGREALFRSLADHLLARYPVPPMLWSVFFDPPTRHFERLVVAVTNVAAGGSLYDTARDPAFPIPLTRRMCHDVLTLRLDTTLLHALRRAQVSAAGGDARLFTMWMRTAEAQTLGGRDEEVFGMTLLTWLARNALPDPAQLGPLMDYIVRRRHLDPSFSMSGRSAAAMRRGMVEWHRELAQAKVVHGAVFEPSGFAPATFDLSGRGREGTIRRQIWRVEEIRTTKELAAEGRRMGHCVHSYAWSIEKRQTSIWAMTLEDGLGATGRWAMLTIEVRNETKHVVQARGRFNRAATSAEYNILLRWAGANGLAVVI